MRKTGFTLFEVMVTLAILGVVFSILYTTFFQSMGVMAQTEDRAEVIRQGRMILERMTQELKGCFLVPGSNPSSAFLYGLICQPLKEGKEDRDRIDFTTCGHPFGFTREARREIVEVGYYLDHEPGGKGLTLFRRQDEGLDGDLLQGGRSLALCDRVRSLSFTCFDLLGIEEKNWNSLEGNRRRQLPLRIEIRLEIEDAHGQIHPFRTQVHLPVAGVKG
jgi:prepilin-type N-terminal cleavage/methylation domain-containing protein